MPTTTVAQAIRSCCRRAGARRTALAVGKYGARHRLVDHRNRLRLAGVRGGEPAAAHQPRAHRLEGAVGHDLPVALGVARRAVPRSRRCRAPSRQSSSPAAARARRPPPPRRAACARARPARDRSHHLLRRVVARGRHRQAHREHAVGIEAEIDAAERRRGCAPSARRRRPGRRRGPPRRRPARRAGADGRRRRWPAGLPSRSASTRFSPQACAAPAAGRTAAS